MTDRNVKAGDETPPTLVERVHAQLRRDIIEGRHAPGAKLRIERLKALYGVGGGTCREALTLLQSDSLVTLFGERGFRVAEVSYEDFADITKTRLLLEVEALRQSLAHGDENWEAELVAAFHRLSRADETLPMAGPDAVSNWELRNQAFHATLISACPSRWIKQFVAVLYHQAERYRRLMLAEGSPLKAEWPRQKKEHADIFEAAMKRDIECAAERLTAHIGRPLRDIRALPIFAEPPAKSAAPTRSRGKRIK